MFPFQFFSLENNKDTNTNTIIKTPKKIEQEKIYNYDLELCELKSMFMIKLQDFLYKSQYSLNFFYKILFILKNKHNDTNFHNFIDNVLILHMKQIYSEGIPFVIHNISNDLEKYNNIKYLALLYIYINIDNSKFNSNDYLQHYINNDDDDNDYNEVIYDKLITEKDKIEKTRLETFYNTCG